jgi:hypothetical protein
VLPHRAEQKSVRGNAQALGPEKGREGIRYPADAGRGMEARSLGAHARGWLDRDDLATGISKCGRVSAGARADIDKECRRWRQQVGKPIPA